MTEVDELLPGHVKMWMLSSSFRTDDEAAVAFSVQRGRRRQAVLGRTDLVGDEPRLLIGLLDELGFAPQRRDSRGEPQVGLRHCPFLELAEGKSSVVCPIHLGLMQGALEAWHAPVTVDRLEAFVEPDLCLAHIAPRAAS